MSDPLASWRIAVEPYYAPDGREIAAFEAAAALPIRPPGTRILGWSRASVCTSPGETMRASGGHRRLRRCAARRGGRPIVLDVSTSTANISSWRGYTDGTGPHTAGIRTGGGGSARRRALRRAGLCVEHPCPGAVPTPARLHRPVILLTDGQPHDVDSHDPRYLREGFRQARKGVAQMDIEVIAIDPAAPGR